MTKANLLNGAAIVMSITLVGMTVGMGVAVVLMFLGKVHFIHPILALCSLAVAILVLPPTRTYLTGFGIELPSNLLPAILAVGTVLIVLDVLALRGLAYPHLVSHQVQQLILEKRYSDASRLLDQAETDMGALSKTLVGHREKVQLELSRESCNLDGLSRMRAHVENRRPAEIEALFKECKEHVPSIAAVMRPYLDEKKEEEQTARLGAVSEQRASALAEIAAANEQGRYADVVTLASKYLGIGGDAEMSAHYVLATERLARANVIPNCHVAPQSLFVVGAVHYADQVTALLDRHCPKARHGKNGVIALKWNNLLYDLYMERIEYDGVQARYRITAVKPF